MSDEGRWDLPPSWQWARATEFAGVVGGGTPKNAKSPDNYAADGIPWITPADLSDYTDTYISRGARDLSEKGFASCSARLMPKGTVLLSSRAPVGYCAVASNEISTNQGFKSFVLRGAAIAPEYLRYYLIGSKQYLESEASGTTFLELSGGRAEQLLFPLAPTNEQQRIVSKIDELFSRIDEGERALERVSMLVERYRQSVLKAAVTGELTREWREKNKDKLESGEVLLARILKARREAWEKAELAKMKAKGITPANDKWKQKYKEPVSPDTTDLPELPQGWKWVSVDQIALDTLIGLDCGAPEQSIDPAGRSPYIKMNNITMDGRVLFDGLVYVSAGEAERYRFSASNGDILFNTRNSKELVGKTGLVVNAPTGALYNNNIMRIRTVPHADPRYVVTHMCEPTFRSRLELVKKATTSVAAVYAKDLFPLALALPPQEEQEQIMSEVDRAVEAAHHMQQEMSARVRAAAALRQSILREAFRGGLVPQDAADEPATALLERIAADRAAPGTAAPRRGRRRKPA